MADKNVPSWSESDSEMFLSYGAGYTPEQAYQYHLVQKLVGTVPDLQQAVDLCCGGGGLSEVLLKNFPEIRVLALDKSPIMLKGAEKRLAAYGARINLQEFDLGEKNWRSMDGLGLAAPANAFVSSLAVHHLPGKEKLVLFKDLWAMLAPGGVFVLLDLVRGAGKIGDEIAAEAWDNWVENHCEAEAVRIFKEEGWNYYRDPEGDPIDQPSRLTELLKWMEEAGFCEVDVFWMRAGNVVLAGWK